MTINYRKFGGFALCVAALLCGVAETGSAQDLPNRQSPGLSDIPDLLSPGQGQHQVCNPKDPNSHCARQASEAVRNAGGQKHNNQISGRTCTTCKKDDQDSGCSGGSCGSGGCGGGGGGCGGIGGGGGCGGGGGLGGGGLGGGGNLGGAVGGIISGIGSNPNNNNGNNNNNNQVAQQPTPVPPKERTPDAAASGSTVKTSSIETF